MRAGGSVAGDIGAGSHSRRGQGLLDAGRAGASRAGGAERALARGGGGGRPRPRGGRRPRGGGSAEQREGGGLEPASRRSSPETDAEAFLAVAPPVLSFASGRRR